MSVYKPKRTGTHQPYARFYISFADHHQIRHKLPAFKMLRPSEQLEQQLLELVATAANRQSLTLEQSRWLEGLPGKIRKKLADWQLIDAQHMAAGKPLRNHIADWVDAIRNKDITAERVRLAEYRLNRVAEKAAYWTDLTPELLRTFLAKLQETENASAYTHNGYVQLIRQFCRWMIQEGRTTQSPAVGLAMFNVKADRRHVRRTFTVDELRKLLAKTDAGPERYGMAGSERAMMYRLAVETGLRAGEIRALTRQCFKLDDRPPTVELGAEHTKNGQYALLELRPDTATALKKFLAEKMPMAAAFNMPPKWNIINILKADLKATGIPYADDMGRVLDFHSFRHTCGAWLAQQGAHPKVIQALMRHSTITLTMDTYGHRLMESESQALAKLPDLNIPPAGEAVKVTGTAGKVVSNYADNSVDINSIQSRILPDLAGSENNSASMKKTRMDSGKTLIYAGESTQPPRGLEPLTYALRKHRSTD